MVSIIEYKSALAAELRGLPEITQFLLLCSAKHNRNNWVLSGGPRGAAASADLYSLIETIKLNGLDPYFSLRYILTRLPTISPDSLADLLPWNVSANYTASIL
jgi:hypothetical protein